jgi:hypothetical protein
MAKKPCRVKLKNGEDIFDMSMSEFMTELRDGLLRQFIEDGSIGKYTREPFDKPEEPKAQPQPRPRRDETADQMRAFMTQGLGEAVNDLRERGYSERMRADLGTAPREYVRIFAERMEQIVREKFNELKARYEAGETGVFNDLLKSYNETSLGEMKDTFGLLYAYHVMFSDVADYFQNHPDKSKRKNHIKYRELLAEIGTVLGQGISALSAEATISQLANRINQEQESRDKFMSSNVSEGKTVQDVVDQVEETVSPTTEEVTAVVTDVTNRPKKTATVVKSDNQKKRQAAFKAISDIMSEGTAPGPIALSMAKIGRITPHIIEIARTYIADGAYTIDQVKRRVWNTVKNAFPGEKDSIDSIIDSNSSLFESELKSNEEKSTLNKLANALERAVNERDESRKRAKSILAQAVLQNDPEYIAAKLAGKKLKASERLKKILNDKALLVGIMDRAKNLAIGNVNSNTSIDPANKQAIINAIEDMAADVLGLPIGKSEMRSAASALSDEDIKAKINEIVINHYKNPTAEIKSLAQKLVEDLGIDPAYANQIEQEVEARIKKIVEDKIKAQEGKMNNILEGIKNADSVKTAIIKAVSKGNVTNTALGDVIAEAMGYKGFSQKDIDTLKNYFERLQNLEPGEELYREINKYVNNILNEYDESTAALIGRWIQSQFYINALSDFVKTAAVNSGIGAILTTIQHGGFTALSNPARMARAIKYAKRMKKAKATLGWQTVIEKFKNPEKTFGETTMIDRMDEGSHDAVYRVTSKDYAQILDDIKNAKGGRKGYFVAMGILKTLSHSMLSGKRKSRFLPPVTTLSMKIMSAQDMIMGGVLQDVFTYINAERYIDALNSAPGPRLPFKKGTAQWNEYINSILNVDPTTLANLQADVQREANERVALGEELPRGWSRRRLREKIHSNMPGTVVDEMATDAKKALFLQRPETPMGAAVFNFLTRKVPIQQKDSPTMVVGRTLLGLTFGFARLSIISAEYAYKAMPIVPAVAPFVGAKRVVYSDGEGQTRKFTNEEKARRVIQNLVLTTAFAGMVMSMFDWDDEEEEVTIDDNSLIKFYGSAENNDQKAEIESSGGEENCVNVFGKNIPFMMLGPGFGTLAKILGEVSNDVRFGKENKKDITWDSVMELIIAQLSGSEYSVTKKTAEQFERGNYMVGMENILLDGVETAVSPSLFENVRKDYLAYKGNQMERRSQKGLTGLYDNIVEDIMFLDVFTNTNGGYVYDHFGKPVYITPSNPILKALVAENVWKDGTSHVKNSPYYNLTQEKWHPSAYTGWSANSWTKVKDGFDPRVELMDNSLSDDLHMPLNMIIATETTKMIDENIEEIKALPTDEKKVEKLEKIRQKAIDNVSKEFYNRMKVKEDVKDKKDVELKRYLFDKRELVVDSMLKEYNIPFGVNNLPEK